MPCTSHHSLHCWKLPSRIRTPLSTCLDATVDIVEIDEGTEVKARTDGRRTRIGGTEVPGPGPRGRVAHERKEFFVAPNDHQGSAELPEIELKKQ